MMGEAACRGFKNSLILRLFNVYSAGGKSHSVVNKFADLHSRREKLPVHGSPDHTRDYVHLDDVVAAITLGVEGGLRGTFNVGSGEETSLQTIADLLGGVSGRAATIELTGKGGLVARSAADISRLRARGWSPRVTIEEGLRQVWEALKPI